MTDTATENSEPRPPRDVAAERGVGRPVPERAVAGMTNAELRAEIGRLQSELIRRVCGDPVQGVGLKTACTHASWTEESVANGWRSQCRGCGAQAQGSGQ